MPKVELQDGWPPPILSSSILHQAATEFRARFCARRSRLTYGMIGSVDHRKPDCAMRLVVAQRRRQAAPKRLCCSEDAIQAGWRSPFAGLVFHRLAVTMACP